MAQELCGRAGGGVTQADLDELQTLPSFVGIAIQPESGLFRYIERNVEPALMHTIIVGLWLRLSEPERQFVATMIVRLLDPKERPSGLAQMIGTANKARGARRRGEV
jgi:hypothetical protein